MKYIGGLVKKEREEIFRLFLNKTKLKFSEIERSIGIRSNMVAYHLEQMQKEGLLEKRAENYVLTREGERYIPIFTHVTGKELSPLPVVLIAAINSDGDKILLIKRNKRPYKGYWSMIGGKMLIGENFEQASLRLVEDRASLFGEFKSINSVMYEMVEGDDIIKHGFILFFTKVIVDHIGFRENGRGELKWFNLKGIEKERIIPSDLWLIQNKLGSKIDIKEAHMTEEEGKLSSFRILE